MHVAQIERLIDLVGLPNITVQVMPFRYGGHAADGGAFTIMRFPETDLPDVVYMEYLTGAHYIDKPEEVEHYAAVMERLSVAATSANRTREILPGILREIYNSCRQHGGGGRPAGHSGRFDDAGWQDARGAGTEILSGQPGGKGDGSSAGHRPAFPGEPDGVDAGTLQPAGR